MVVAVDLDQVLVELADRQLRRDLVVRHVRDLQEGDVVDAAVSAAVDVVAEQILHQAVPADHQVGAGRRRDRRDRRASSSDV